MNSYNNRGIPATDYVVENVFEKGRYACFISYSKKRKSVK